MYFICTINLPTFPKTDDRLFRGLPPDHLTLQIRFSGQILHLKTQKKLFKLIINTYRSYIDLICKWLLRMGSETEIGHE